MVRFRRLYDVSFILCVALLWMLVHPLPSVASLPECSDQGRHIFVRNTALPNNNYGQANKIEVADRLLEESCQSGVWHTANFTRGPCCGLNWYYYVEVGWTKQRGSDGSTSLCRFWEEQQGSGAQAHYHPKCDSPLSYGSYSRFKVDGTDQNGHFRFYIDYGDTGDYTYISDYQADWQTGIDLGESEKLGQDTSLAEDQRYLHFYTQGNWQPWTDVDCIVDESDGWYWHAQSTNSYTVNQISNPNPCV